MIKCVRPLDHSYSTSQSENPSADPNLSFRLFRLDPVSPPLRNRLLPASPGTLARVRVDQYQCSLGSAGIGLPCYYSGDDQPGSG